MHISREKTNMMAVLAMALCVMVASACWMMMRFGSMVTAFEFASSDYMNWILHAYIICDIAMIPLGGKLSDHFGERKVLVMGASLFLLGAILCTVSDSFAVMSWFRGIMGAGAGLLIGAAFSVPGTIGKYFRGLSFGQELMAGAFAIGSLFGAATGYFILEHIDNWRYLFYIPIVLMVLGVAMAWVTLPEKPVDERRFDIQGTLLLVLLFFTISVTIQLVDVKFFFNNMWSLLLIPFIGMIALALYYRQKLSEFPAIPRGIGRPVILQILVLVLISVFVIGLLQLYLKIYLLDYELDIYKASLMFLCLLVGAMCTSIPGGHKVGKTGVRPFLMLGCLLMAVSLAITYFFITSGVAYLHLIMVILGAGLGCIVTVIICSIQYNTPVRDRGTVTGIAVAARMVGIIAGLAGVTNYTVLNIDSYLESILGVEMSGSMDIVEIIAAIIAVLIQTGIDVTDTVLGLYVDSFRDWSVGSLLVLIAIGVFCYFGYKGRDAVPPEVENAECAGYEPPSAPETSDVESPDSASGIDKPVAKDSE